MLVMNGEHWISDKSKQVTEIRGLTDSYKSCELGVD